MEGPNCGISHWKIIFTGSCFTKDSESQYAPIEEEALALIYGLESCRMFVLGCLNLIVSVDHKPLIKVFSDKTLEDLKNPHVFKFKEQSLIHNFTIKHTSRKVHSAPDATFQYPWNAPHRKLASNIIVHTECLTAKQRHRHGWEYRSFSKVLHFKELCQLQIIESNHVGMNSGGSVTG